MIGERAARMVGVDFDARKCRMARELLAGFPQAEVVEGDICAYAPTVPRGAFDVVIFADTLSSIPQQHHAPLVAEAARIVGDQGRVILKIVDTGPWFKALLSNLLFILVCRIAKASVSMDGKVHYQPHEVYVEQLESFGLEVELEFLHQKRHLPFPHLLIIGTRKARA
jgi:ubiquinone/menaquinone biosynthesis C-methylase UbiE